LFTRKDFVWLSFNVNGVRIAGHASRGKMLDALGITNNIQEALAYYVPRLGEAAGAKRRQFC
jgi:hypothetical protein